MSKFNQIDIKKFLDSLPPELIEEKNKLQAEENERIYNDFAAKLKVGECFLCNGKMDEFDISKPCFHWFTNPKGIKKKHFENYLKKPIGFFALDSYFRWLANTEKPFGNINDLKDETSTSSYLETTYKYKNIEWAFSIGHTDKEGHINGKIGAEPHFHIQMKVDDRVFLNFNHFHIPFSDGDLFSIELIEKGGDKVKVAHSYGYGMGVLEDEGNLKIIDESLTTTNDIENAPFTKDTIFIASEGEKISGEILRQAIKENKITKEPIGRIMQKLLSKNTKVISIISPGKGVPKMTKRSGKK
mgnify:CR=1 FL=1